MSKICTKTGDLGETSLKGGRRVPKTDIRIEANGSLDELNCVIGVARAELSDLDERQVILKDIQLNIMRLMSFIAGLPSEEITPISEDEVERIEKRIDALEESIIGSDYFILPGGTRISSLFHLARATARRAERIACSLNDKYPLPLCVKSYINRLSDLFFILARQEMQISGAPEERWKMFSTRKKKD